MASSLSSLKFMLILVHHFIFSCHADKFSVLSFLEALDDSVAKDLESGGSTLGTRDSRAQTHGSSDPMDEGQ